MKYPEKQFNELCESLAKVKEVFGEQTLLNCPACSLHFFIYSQKNFNSDNANVKFINGKRMFEQNESFLLYPEGCNDNHIETAMRKAYKTIKD